MTKTISRSIIATLIAIVIATYSLGIIMATNANAAGYDGTAQGNAALKAGVVEKTKDINVLAKAYYLKAVGKAKQGYDWTYKATNNNIKVKCKYDFDTHKYTFKFTGTAKGSTKLTLQYKSNEKTWVKVPMTFKVDSHNNIKRVA
jgi:hypothetical protein